MVVPETPYPVEPYIGGYTSYMKISTLWKDTFGDGKLMFKNFNI